MTTKDHGRHLLLAAAPFAALIVLYYPVAGFDFLTWDDEPNLLLNPFLHPASWAGVVRFWLEPYERLYAPLSFTYFAALGFLSRLLTHSDVNAAIFHSGNVVLHAGATATIFRILKTLGLNVWACCLGATLFAVHPLQVESVAWAFEARGLLAGLGGLTAILLYLRSAQATGRRRTGILALATVACGLALVAKPSAVAVPVMALLLEGRCRKLEGSGRDARSWRLGAVALWVVMALVVTWVNKLQQLDAAMARCTPPLALRPYLAGDIVGFYGAKLLKPWDLAFDYGRSPAVVAAAHPQLWIIPALIGAGLLLGSLRQRSRGGLLGLGTAAALVVAGLLPFLGLVPFGFQCISSVADHYMYLPMFGVSYGFALLCNRITRPWQRLAPVALLIGLAVLTSRQIPTWKNSEALYRHALDVNPKSYIAHNNLANLLADEGQLAEAADHYRAALVIDPGYDEAHFNLGNLHARLNHHADARSEYELALAVVGDDPKYRRALGRELLTLGKLAEAEAQLRAAITAQPGYEPAYADLGALLLRLGRTAEAIRTFEAMNGAAPDSGFASYDLAIAYSQAGDDTAALRHMQAAVQRHPDEPMFAFGLGNLLLAKKEIKGAVESFQTALRLKERYPEAHNNLGQALEAAGMAEAAVREYRQAIDLQPSYLAARVNLGNLLLRLGHELEGRRILEEVGDVRQGLNAKD